MAFPADLAEVASSAIAEVASLADIAEVAPTSDLAGDITVGVMSLADPVGVVTAGVAFREECGERDVVPSDCVCVIMVIISMMHSMTMIVRTILTIYSI